jgi:Homing endonuclease associated repeat
MTKEEVIAAVLKCATNLGRVPTREELMNHGGVNHRDLRRNFGTLRQALRECKLERSCGNRKVDMENLFHDWARVARSLKKLPTMKEYEALSQYSVRPLKTRFVSWNFVPGGLKRFAEGSGLAEEWKDVLELVHDTREPRPASPLTFAGPFAQTMPGPAHVRYADTLRGTGICADERVWSAVSVWSNRGPARLSGIASASGVSGY